MENTATIVDDSENTYVYYPVTLAQIEAAGVILNGAFGCDADEHSELLNDPDILRLVVQVYVDEGADRDDEMAIIHSTYIETLQATLQDPTPRWTCCYKHYFGDGGMGRTLARENNRKLSDLLTSVAPDLEEVLEKVDAPLLEYIADWKRDNPED